MVDQMQASGGQSTICQIPGVGDAASEQEIHLQAGITAVPHKAIIPNGDR